MELVELKKGLSANLKTVENLFSDKDQALKFHSAAIACFQNNTTLASCTKASLVGAFLECARTGLFPSNWQGECYILPYKDCRSGQTLAQFQIGYKGFVTLFYRCGVDSIYSDIVYENDEFEYETGLEMKLKHKPKLGNRGKAIGAYAVATLNGQKIFKVMGEEDIMTIANMSQSMKADKKYNTKKSIWHGANDPEKWMWQKTVIKQLAKLLPKTEKLSHAIHLDNISERGGYIKDENTIVDIPFEEKSEKSEIKPFIERLEKVTNREELDKIVYEVKTSDTKFSKSDLGRFKKKWLEINKLLKAKEEATEAETVKNNSNPKTNE